MSLLRYYLNDPFYGVDRHHRHHHLARRRQNAYDAMDALMREQESLFGTFDDLFNSPMVRSPPVELREDGTDYVVEAELPGVKKEDLDVRVGEGGKSLTIEGRVFRRSGGGDTADNSQIPDAPSGSDQAQTTAKETTAEASEGTVAKTGSKDVTQQQNAESFSTYSSTFSRTFQFPRPVDGSRVQARLVDGILSLRVPQLEDTKGVRVNID